VQDESFLGRNASSIGGFTIVATLILSMSTLVIIFLK
jgi:hypothetical protein